jgi:hypothetical protein
MSLVIWPREKKFIASCQMTVCLVVFKKTIFMEYNGYREQRGWISKKKRGLSKKIAGTSKKLQSKKNCRHMKKIAAVFQAAYLK